MFATFRRRLFRWGIVLFLLACVLLFFAPTIVANTGLRNRIIPMATKDLNGSAEIGGMSLGWFSPVELRDVTIKDTSGKTVIVAPKITTSKTLLQLAFNRVDVGTITLKDPKVDLVVENGKTNLELLLDKYIKGDGTPAKPERTAVNVVVENGTLNIHEPAMKEHHTISNVMLDMKMPRSRDEAIKVALKCTAEEAINAEFEIGNASRVKLKAKQFSLQQLGPIARLFEPSVKLNGLLNSDLTVTWGKGNISADGSANVSDLTVNAKWLGTDTLKMQSIAVNSRMTSTAERMTFDELSIICDVGRATFNGAVDPNADPLDWLNQSGLSLSANLDVAKVAQLLPNTLKIKEGMEIREGSIVVSLKSLEQSVWEGSAYATSLKGTRNGQSIIWEQPIKATFKGKLRPDHLPVFEDLTVQSDFIGMRARGEPEAFAAAANIYLHKLSAHLADFVDLGITMSGIAHVSMQSVMDKDHIVTLNGSGTLENVEILDKKGVVLREKELKLKLDAKAKKLAPGKYRIDTGVVNIASGEDGLDVTLLDPIADLKSFDTGKARVKLTGELARWKSRLGPIVGIPERWVLGGLSIINADLHLEPKKYILKNLDGNIKNAVFQCNSVNLAEPDLTATGQLTYDVKTDAVTFTKATLSCDTVGANVNTLSVVPTPSGDYGIAGDVNFQANVARVQKLLKMQSDPKLGDQFRGLAKGKAKFDIPSSNIIKFDADVKVEQFSYGSPQKPSWTEPWLTLKGDGQYDYESDGLKFQNVNVARDGLSASVQGSIDKMSTTTDLNLEGTVTYDLSKLEPALKDLLGKSSQATGTGTKPFRITGDLTDGGKNLAVNVGPPKEYSQLAGNAAIEWKTLKAYGFDVGQAELRANIDKGYAKMSPVEATFGGGKVRIEPTVHLNPGAYDMTFAKGPMIQRAKLTPAACAEAVGYALPLIANVAQADGTISFDMGDNKIPLVDPTLATLNGTLTIHDAEVSPNEIVGQIAGLFTQKPLKMKLVSNSVVAIRVEKGRVYHQNLTINIDGVAIRTSGSVGMDSTLDLIVEVPLSNQIVGNLVPASQPRVRESLAKQTVKVPVRGTLAKPALDNNAFRGEVAKVVQKTMKDMIGGATEDFLKKGLDQFFPKK